MKSRRHRAIDRAVIREYLAVERAFINSMDSSEQFERVTDSTRMLAPFQKAVLRNALRNKGRIPYGARGYTHIMK